MEIYILLIVIAASDFLRFARQLARDRREGSAYQTSVWWFKQAYRIGGNAGVILVGLSAWLPTGPFGWSLCGIAMCCGTRAPCGFAFISNTPSLWFIRNLIFIGFGLGCFAVAIGWLR